MLAAAWLGGGRTRDDIRRWLTDQGARESLAGVLWAVLVRLWEAGYEIGEDAAREVCGFQGAVQGVQALIAAYGAAWVNQIVETRLDWLEEILAEYAGASVRELTALLSQALASAAAAEMVAQTEITRAVAAAAIDVYKAAGYHEVIWVVEDDNACAVCKANARSGPHVYGSPFPSGAISPPEHPHCRCALLPYGEH